MINKLYVASGAENWKLVQDVILRLQLLGFNITHNWTSTFNYWANVKNREGYDFVERQVIGDLELRGVLDADALLVLLPGGVGTHTEFGIALGQSKPILVTDLFNDHDAMNHLCPFYYNENVTHLRNVDQLFDVVPAWRKNG